MTTTKAFSIPMPERNLRTVRDFYLETEMSERHFRVFTANIRLNAAEYLDISGFVSVEEQDPAAFRQFLDKMKISDPTIAKKYPYLWPVLAYLELYILGRRRSHRSYDAHPAIRPRPPKTRLPIWIRFARSEKTGQSLKEISKEASVRSPRVSCPHRWRMNYQPVAERSFKMGATETEVDENINITPPVDSRLAIISPSNTNMFTAPFSQLFRSFGW